MSSNSKIGKIFGVILCLIAVAIFLGIFIFSADIRGYNKFLTKYYSSIQRDVEDDYSASFYGDVKVSFEDAKKSLVSDKAEITKDYFNGSIIKFKVKSSEKLDQNQISAYNSKNEITKAYKLKVLVTFSIDQGSNKTTHELTVGKVNGKWKILQ